MEDTTGNVTDGISLGLSPYILEGLRYLSLEAAEMDNREIDKLVAEKIMGWKPGKQHIREFTWADVWRNEDGRIMVYYQEWKPSSNISTAWRVIEKLGELGWRYELGNTRSEDTNWVRFIRGKYNNYENQWDEQYWAEGNVPMAICLAALKWAEAPAPYPGDFSEQL